MVSVRIRLSHRGVPFEGMTKKAMAAVQKEAKAVLLLLRQWQHIAILQSKKPDSSPQKKNADSTVKKKERWKKGEGNEEVNIPIVAPLVGKNMSLYSEENWKLTTNKRGVFIKQPRVFNLLKGKGYEVITTMGIPKKYINMLELRIQKALDRM